MLNKQSMRCSNFYPSDHFVDCLFTCTQLFDGCLDFRLYLDYFFAVTFPSAPAAGRYVFETLTQPLGKDFLDRADIAEAFGSVYADMERMY